MIGEMQDLSSFYSLINKKVSHLPPWEFGLEGEIFLRVSEAGIVVALRKEKAL